jgi:hypothetical protein
MTELLNQTVVLCSLSNLGISGSGAAEPRNNEKIGEKIGKMEWAKSKKLIFENV